MAKKIEKLTGADMAEFMAAVNKKYGKGTLIKGSQIKRTEVPRATTGSLSFDVMLGGGWPLNNWNQIVGNFSSGKTVLALQTVAANQRRDPNWECMWVAAEEWIPEWAAINGVDESRLWLVETNIMEEVYEIVNGAIDNQLIDGVVIDSLPALIPSEESIKAMEEFGQAVGARLTNKFMRKSHTSQKRDLVEQERDCLAIFINQWRMKIGIQFGDPRTTPGGQGKDFASFTEVEVARDEWLTISNPQDSNNPIKVGQAIKARTRKNKTAPPQQTATVDFYFSDQAAGFSAGSYDTLKEVINLAIAYDVIAKDANTYRYEGVVLSNKGRPMLEATIREDVQLQDKLTKDVLMLTTRNGEPQ